MLKINIFKINRKFVITPIKIRVACACYCPSPMAAKLSLLLNSSGLIIFLPSIRMGCLMFCFKSSGLGFFVVEGGVVLQQQMIFLKGCLVLKKF